MTTASAAAIRASRASSITSVARAWRRSARRLRRRSATSLRRYHRTGLFVLTLGYSRKCVRLIVFTSSTRTWTELHRSTGGSPRVLVLDNPREGVLKPDISLHRDMLAHYQAIALPCRIKNPDRKGKVESSVGHAQKNASERPASRSTKRKLTWIVGEEQWTDTHIHGTDGCVEVELCSLSGPALKWSGPLASKTRTNAITGSEGLLRNRYPPRPLTPKPRLRS